MTPYNEEQVLAFAEDAVQAFHTAGVLPPTDAAKWIALMQCDAVTLGYPLARAKYLQAICEGLGVQELKPAGDAPISPPSREQFLTWIDGPLRHSVRCVHCGRLASGA